MTERSHSPWNAALIALLALLALYFVFPGLIYYPLEFMWRKKLMNEQVYSSLQYVFAPLGKIAEACPPYDKFLEAQGNLADALLPKDAHGP